MSKVSGGAVLADINGDLSAAMDYNTKSLRLDWKRRDWSKLVSTELNNCFNRTAYESSTNRFQAGLQKVLH
jgi:hypothetical protein